jgi:hypothetical protein
MVTGEIPEDVQRFLADNIDSVPHLEALLLLWESAPADWTVDAVAARIYVKAPAAAALLEDLSRRSMLSRASADPAKYRFDSTNETQRAILQRVATAYRTQLVRVAQFIHSKASGSVRDFARAFKLKSDDK